MLTLEQYEQLNPYCEITQDGVAMRFITPNVLTRWRVETIRQKEPWTLEWIAGFDASDTLVDVGANVGMYTIWAAATRKVRVFSFEPEAQNYSLLNRNIFVNGLQDRVTAYCVGLIDKTGFTDLHIADTRMGGSCHSVGEALDFKNEKFNASHRQGCVSETLDNLVGTQKIPVPTHIKVDVDGLETRVIGGAMQTLRNAACRSLLIEVNTNLDSHRQMVASLIEMGFALDDNQVQRAMRKEGTFKGVAEHVFKR